MLIKALLWLAVYPIMCIGYITVTAWDLVSFLFNSPVDVWMIISRSVDDSQEEIQ